MKKILYICFIFICVNSMAQEPDRNSWECTLDSIVITTEEIANGESSILIVRHEEGHGGWQLYDGSDVSNKNPFVLPKVEALKLDPSLKEIIDLPCGLGSYQRK